MNKYNKLFFLFLIISALVINWYKESTDEVVFLYSNTESDNEILKNILSKTSTKVTIIPENSNVSLLYLNQLQKLRPIYKIANIEHFSDVIVNNIYRKKPKMIYCNKNSAFYNLVNKINVVGYPFPWSIKIPYYNWNYVGKSRNLNENENRLRDYIDQRKK